jgi:hypothetical protein
MRNDLSALDTALELQRRGLWPVVLYPIGATIRTKDGPKRATGKEPIGKAWGTSRPTEDALRRAFVAHPGAGIGIVLGPNGGVVDIEVDGAEGERSLLELFGGEQVETLGWSSHRGPHRLFQWDDRLADIDPRHRAKLTLQKLPGLEFRFGQNMQAQSACPPTVGENGEPRRWNAFDAIAALPDAVIQRLAQLLAFPRHETNGTLDRTPPEASDRAGSWFRKALENVGGKVATAREGTRHDTLFDAARTLGGYLHHEYLTEAEITASLMHAAGRAGLPVHEIAPTIRDGIENGRANPLPWPERLSRSRSSAERTGGSEAPSTRTDDDKRETQAETLLRLASVARLIRTDEGRTFASVPVDKHYEVHEVRSHGFKQWLTRAFYKEQIRPPSADAMQGALGVLDARAQFEGTTERVFVRVAPGDGEAVYVDLADNSWRVIRVSLDGWVLEDRAPMWFRRPRGMRPLPTPEPGGAIQLLRQFANVTEHDFPLVVAWLTGAMLPTGPYPVLVLSGEQGSAKSTLARILRHLSDPHVSPLRSEPKEVRDLMISAVNGWVVAFDNLSTVPTWLSDALCRLSTGGGTATRQLYSDSEEFFLDAQRPTILTGIEDFVRRGDLADRCLFLHLPAIPETGRRTEADFWSEFDTVRPQLFGAILTAIAGGLRLLPKVERPGLPRMADFAKWGEAVCQSLGWNAGAFLEAYQQNRHDANEAALEDSPVATVVRLLMARRSEWEGTATALLEELCRLLPDRASVKDRWPKTARGLSGHLRRVAPSLRMAGLDVAFGVGRNRRIRLSPVNPGDQPCQPAQPAPEAHEQPGFDYGCARCNPYQPAQPAPANHEQARSDYGCARCNGQTAPLTGTESELSESLDSRSASPDPPRD